MINVSVSLRKDGQIHQGDIYKDIEYIEYANIIDGKIFISKIHFQYVIVLSQECDLTQDYSERKKNNTDDIKYDKILQSIIVAPMFNFEHFKEGSQLSNLGYNMADSYKAYKSQKGSTLNTLMNNNNPRFHYLEFDESNPIVPSVVDFKRFFTVDCNWLYSIQEENYMCSLDELFRERFSQRFANFLSRIGLPGEA